MLYVKTMLLNLIKDLPRPPWVHASRLLGHYLWESGTREGPEPMEISSRQDHLLSLPCALDDLDSLLQDT